MEIFNVFENQTDTKVHLFASVSLSSVMISVVNDLLCSVFVVSNMCFSLVLNLFRSVAAQKQWLWLCSHLFCRLCSKPPLQFSFFFSR